MKRLLVAAAALVAAPQAAGAAVLTWQLSGTTEVSYTQNVYLQGDDTTSGTPSSWGGGLAANLKMLAKSPRSRFTLNYNPAYNYYSRATSASNLEHYLTLEWTYKASQKTNFWIGESARYSIESDNLRGRGVDKAYTVGPRARQTRSGTELGLETQISPRWSLRTRYAYDLLRNGKVFLGVPATGSEFLVESTLFDEDAHTGVVGAVYQVSPSSKIGVKTRFVLARDEGPSELSIMTDTDGTNVSSEVSEIDITRRTRSQALILTYEWAASERLNTWFGIGPFRSKDRILVSESSVSSELSRNDVSAEAGFALNSSRGSLSMGFNRDPSTFEGLARNFEQVTTNDLGQTVTTDVPIPAGGATRTTVYVSYNYQIARPSKLFFAVNGTQRDAVETNARITTAGVEVAYDLRFADWGGLHASYRYTWQASSDDQLFPGHDLSRNLVGLGFFFGRP